MNTSSAPGEHLANAGAGRRIEVLRLGHRPQRDKRITTHVCLTARALGAHGISIAGSDPSVVASVRDVVTRFGGTFRIDDGVKWRQKIGAWQEKGGMVIHLSMYGDPLASSLSGLDGRDLLVVVGAEKVPGDLYRLADRNVAIGDQPHSEVAALGVFMDRVVAGAWEAPTHP